MAEHVTPRQRGAVHRMRGRSVSARPVGEPASAAKIILHYLNPKLGYRLSQPVDKAEEERLVAEALAARLVKLEKATATLEGLNRIIEQTQAEIAALEGGTE